MAVRFLRVRASRWRAALVFFSLVARPVAARSAPEDGSADEQARKAVANARTLAARDQWQEALANYEKALVLKPAPKLYFNIGVCHHQLMVRADDPTARDHHRRKAIGSYESYLAVATDADDRAAVAQLVDDLHKSTSTGASPLFIPRIEDADSSDSMQDAWADANDDTSDPLSTEAVADPTSPPANRRPKRRAQIFGAVGTALAHPVDLVGNHDIDGPWTLGGSLQVTALLGPRRRVHLGGELSLFAAPWLNTDRHRLAWLRGSVVANMAFSLGRIELAAGGILGVVGQALAMPRSSTTGATCPVDDRTASRRGGGTLGARGGAGVRLGTQRRHLLALRVTPALLVMGTGTRDEDDECSDGPSAFREFGLPAGSAFVLDVDFGYGIRF